MRRPTRHPQPATRPRKAPRPRGFTLIELLIAVTLTVLMLLAINTIFNSARDMVAVGNGLSEVMANARTVHEQIDRDGRRMLGPGRGEGGFLVIVQHVRPAPVVADDVAGPGLNPLTARRIVRSDQLVFIRRRAGLEPMAPSNVTSYGADSTLNTQFVKVWYGHVLRTAPDGLGSSAAPPYAVGDLGFPDGGADPPIPGTNELASEWILGRQAMFLEGDLREPSDPNEPAPPPDNLLVRINTSDGWAEPQDVNNNSGWKVLAYNSAWYFGHSDVIDLGLNDVFGPDSTDILHPAQAPATGGMSMTDQQYVDTALRFAYVYGGGRLLVNPHPRPSNQFSPQSQIPLSSRHIAMMHPVLARGVSDIIVEFAADFENNQTGSAPSDGLVDTSNITGEIKWYGYFHNDPEADEFRLPNGQILNDFQERLPTVYSIPNPAGYGPFEEFDPTDPSDPAYANAAFVWRHDDDQPFDASNPPPPSPAANSRWPYMIRIRYRMHDARNHVGSPTPGFPDGIDNDTDGQTDEPDELATTGRPGREFHVILAVPRP